MLSESKCSEKDCKFFGGVKNDGDEKTERVFCEVYPDGIPDDIAYGDRVCEYLET